MGTERVIIVSSTEQGGGNGKRRFGVGNRDSLGTETEAIKIRTEHLTPKECREVRDDPTTRCLAPSVPMMLHQPCPPQGEPASPAASWGVAAVGADRSPFVGTDVRVAVLDTGIDADHAAFKGIDLKIQDFTDDGDGDVHGHGTHCAGTIFGKPVDGIRIGVSPGIKQALIGKVIGKNGCQSELLVDAIDWAVKNGAHIISMSLGIDFPGLVAIYEREGYPTQLATSKALLGYRANVELFAATVDYHSKKTNGGVIFVAASGNESRRAEREDWVITIGPPAAAEDILSVGALARRADNGYSIAPYSNIGGRVCAPGSDVLSAKAGGGLTVLSGTSMAAPHVAGVAALWAQRTIQRTKRFNAKLVLNGVEGTATTVGIDSPNVDDVGAGMVQAPRD